MGPRGIRPEREHWSFNTVQEKCSREVGQALIGVNPAPEVNESLSCFHFKVINSTLMIGSGLETPITIAHD